ncbi:hypothetical protein CCACVL1_17333, partial [Corchorus capsularis]
VGDNGIGREDGLYGLSVRRKKRKERWEEPTLKGANEAVE